MIRQAIDDSKEAGPTTEFLLDQLTTKVGSYPPHDTVETVGMRLQHPKFICMIDDENQAVAGFHVREAAQEVVVIWWLPRAEWAENNKPQLIPVFVEACKEVVRRWPEAESWPIYGDYPGEGETWSQRRRSSQEIVDVWVVFFNQSPTAGVFAERTLNPDNASQFRLKGTVGKVIIFGEWLAAQ